MVKGKVFVTIPGAVFFRLRKTIKTNPGCGITELVLVGNQTIQELQAADA